MSGLRSFCMRTLCTQDIKRTRIQGSSPGNAAGTFYTARTYGIAKAFDGGYQWNNINPPSVTNITRLMVDPRTSSATCLWATGHPATGNFTTNQVPVLTGPPNGQTGIVDGAIASWNPVIGSTQYHIQFGNSDFSTIYKESYPATNSFTLHPLDFNVPCATYIYWRLQAILCNGSSGWSNDPNW